MSEEKKEILSHSFTMSLNINPNEKIKLPNKNNPDEVYQYISKSISEHSFRSHIRNFINENCHHFTSENDDDLIHQKLFEKMCQIIEKNLNKILSKANLCEIDFYTAAKNGEQDPKYKKYFNQVINMKDFYFFKKIMIKRKNEMAELPEKKIMDIYDNKKEEEEKEKLKKVIQDRLKEEEDMDILKAIQLSLEEGEKRKNESINEQNELDEAIKQSLSKGKQNNTKTPNEIINSELLQISNPSIKIEEEPKNIINNEPPPPHDKEGFKLEASKSNIKIRKNPYNKSKNNNSKKINPKEEEKFVNINKIDINTKEVKNDISVYDEKKKTLAPIKNHQELVEKLQEDIKENNKDNEENTDKRNTPKYTLTASLKKFYNKDNNNDYLSKDDEDN